MERKKERKKEKISCRLGIEREKRVIANTLYAWEANHCRQSDDYSVNCPGSGKTTVERRQDENPAWICVKNRASFSN